MPTDLDLYSIFCTVARCGSLSHAARELYVSQPAISQSMHRLEYTLGCTLFTQPWHIAYQRRKDAVQLCR